MRDIEPSFVVTSVGLVIYRWSGVRSPQRVRTVRAVGLRGIISYSHGLLGWGVEGLAPLCGLVVRKAFECGKEPSVLDVAQCGRVLYVLRRTGIHILDADLCELAVVPFADAERLAVGGDRLAVSAREGLTVFELSRPEAPERIGFTRMLGIRGIERARVGSSRRAVFVRRRGVSGSVLDLTDPDNPDELAQYSRRPWYVDGARLGRLYARVDDSQTSIELYTVAGEATEYEPPPRLSDIWPGRLPRQPYDRDL